jgi:hypothetical protein
MAALYESGYGLYVPFGENTRCDLVIEREGALDRVQIKTGRLRRGAVVFNVCSTYGPIRIPRSSSERMRARSSTSVSTAPTMVVCI